LCHSVSEGDRTRVTSTPLPSFEREKEKSISFYCNKGKGEAQPGLGPEKKKNDP